MIKSTIQDVEPKTVYPCLKIANNGEVFLLIRKDTGICILGAEHSDNFGKFCDNWFEDTFKHFAGKVVLENDPN